ncbi:Iron-responsive regulator Irr [hydrothermal vent metagenome]|uniref:Iron-responsive regulator Irr n=1 Tax=hydrothermal vent metagenome TaxID=652676 RepID=A0A3B1BN44_9ZZZZ
MDFIQIGALQCILMETLESTKDTPKYSAIELLLEYDITPTQQRVEIANILFARPQHVSAEQVLSQLNSEQQKASKATIYNTLGLFARKGLIREIIVDPTKVFYDSNTSDHHHYYNVDTGMLSDIEDGYMLVSNLPALPEGTVAERVDIIYRVRNADNAADNIQ